MLINCIIIFVFIYVLNKCITDIIEYIDIAHEIEKKEFKNELLSDIKEMFLNILKDEKGEYREDAKENKK